MFAFVSVVTGSILTDGGFFEARAGSPSEVDGRGIGDQSPGFPREAGNGRRPGQRSVDDQEARLHRCPKILYASLGEGEISRAQSGPCDTYDVVRRDSKCLNGQNSQKFIFQRR